MDISIIIFVVFSYSQHAVSDKMAFIKDKEVEHTHSSQRLVLL